MKAKIVGFKVGEPRPTYNRTIEIIDFLRSRIPPQELLELGEAVYTALARSDFLSVRRVKD